MDNKSLSLPNRSHYRDDVIGQVVQRIKFTSHYAQTPKIYEEDDTTHVFSKRNAPLDVTSLDRISPRTHSRSSTESLDINMPVLEGNDTTPFDSGSETMVKTLKQQHRGYMQRYRTKIKDRATTLESDIRRLQERIQRLQEQYQTTSIGVSICITVWHVVAEYFRLFRCGLKKSTGEPWTTVEERSSCMLRAQRDFMYAFMAPDVASNNGTGVETLLDSYRLLAFYLPDFETRIVRMEIVEDMILVTTTVQITLTANTLQRAFPHLAPGAEQHEWLLVAKKLLGKQIVMRGSTRFMWDSTTKHVALLQSSADLLSSILRLLGDIQSVCSAFGESRITPDCTLARPLTW
ncbi:hypothetical protein PPTG_18544 [Phytophthora nicotianae INRA-310]|uniref:Bzip transcription factor n=1 Tax=Phytophthora nicotianae (strain INRA-310) TaxID=761204 RepID=W2PGG2_PHYN3|nr:hypothetical protein PPTG_18544 [Phytophthora nicotianae INRA-310]ETM99966.1 hypothetical protein PPTG_18544 [Phytophthora nicotianae INRA-310]